ILVGVPLAAESLMTIGSFPVTNSVVTTAIVSLGLLLTAFVIRTKRALVPRGIQNLTESILEFILNFMQQVTNDKERARRFLPIVGTLFLFILLSNWLGLLPGVGSIGSWQVVHGEMELIPLFRPAMSDLNTTLALAIFAIVATHIFGIIAIGVWQHANKFFQFGTIVQGFRKGGIHIFVGLIEFVVGIIETIAEVAKVVSLSLRLYGNVFAGEVLLTVIGSLIAFVAPLPFMALELIVGIVQAMVFSMLTLVFMTVLTEKPHHE
ncbi:F0F1 ATP synthase subunit A, partial [Candidatus Uhrbacteria bacterium]|nr:F0F1 ATP synthase subunit A [Candidatus Uhrbacteria bacterium]